MGRAKAHRRGSNGQIPRRGQCYLTRKTVFPTQEAADKRLAEIKAAPRTRVSPERSYQCSACGGFHLTKFEVLGQPLPGKSR